MDIVFAIIIGITGSSVVHLSKGLMKLGIQRSKVPELHHRAGKTRTIYLTGVVLNFSAPVWIMVANLFASPVVYSSMYASGLLALLVFSRYVLHEHLHPRQIVGAFVTVSGTAALGLAEFHYGSLSLTLAQINPLLAIVAAWIIGGFLIAVLTRTIRVTVQELFFGLAAGGFAALDALLKGVAQRSGVSARFIPGPGPALIVLAGSFLVAGLAFAFIQWSYLRHCRASIMGIAYDMSFVALPILTYSILIPGYRLSLLSGGGLILLGIGVVLIASGPLPAVAPVVPDSAGRSVQA